MHMHTCHMIIDDSDPIRPRPTDDQIQRVVSSFDSDTGFLPGAAHASSSSAKGGRGGKGGKDASKSPKAPAVPKRGRGRGKGRR